MSARVSRTNKELKPKEQKSEVRTYILQVKLSPGAVAVEASVRYSQQDNSFTVGNGKRRKGSGKRWNVMGRSGRRKDKEKREERKRWREERGK